MTALSLDIANRIVSTALAEGRQRNFAPLAIAVLDTGGHLISGQREDGAGILRFDLAFGKAWGSLGMGFGSRELARRAAGLPAFITTVSIAAGGRILPSPGGVLVQTTAGGIIGAVGISGDIGDNDEVCAIAGVEAVGLIAIGGEP